MVKSVNEPSGTSDKNLSQFLYYEQTRSPGGTNYNGLYWEASPNRGTFFTLQICKRVVISQGDVYKRVGKSVI